jgi:hypothetical protein
MRTAYLNKNRENTPQLWEKHTEVQATRRELFIYTTERGSKGCEKVKQTDTKLEKETWQQTSSEGKARDQFGHVTL